MKKILALLLVFAMLFSVAAIFAGCNDSGKKKTSSNKEKDEEEEEEGGSSKHPFAKADDLEDLKRKQIGAQAGTYLYHLLRQIPDVHVKGYGDYPAMLEALETGDVDGIVLEETTAYEFCLNNTRYAYIPFVNNETGFTVASEDCDITIMLSSENVMLTGQINELLAEIPTETRQALMKQMVELSCGKEVTEFVLSAPEPAEVSGILRVGMECGYAPLNWTETDAPTLGAVPISGEGKEGLYANGYDVQIAQYIANKLGLQLEIYAIERDSFTSSLRYGTVDCIIGGMHFPMETDGTLAYTAAYYTNNVVILYDKEATPDSDKKPVGNPDQDDVVDDKEDSKEEITDRPVATEPPSPDPTMGHRGNQVGDLLFNYQVELIDSYGANGDTIDPSETEKITILSFWGTWATPSMLLLDLLDETARKYGDSITVIAVHSSVLREDAPAYIGENYSGSPILFGWDSGTSENEYLELVGGFRVYPYTLILDENGVILDKFDGTTTDAYLSEVLETAGAVKAPIEEAGIPTIQDGKLIVATNVAFPPYVYWEAGNMTGVDVEIARELAKRLGLELELRDMEFDEIFQAVKDQKADITLAGITSNTERLQLVDFSQWYYANEQLILAPGDTPIKHADDLWDADSPYIVGVVLDTTAGIYAPSDLGADRVRFYSNRGELIAAMRAGKVDCVMVQAEWQSLILSACPSWSFCDTYSFEYYAIGVSKENTALLNAINDTILQMKHDGTVDAIVAKYVAY